MLRLYLLHNPYSLSDEAMVTEAIDSRVFSDFCGEESSNQAPDGDMLARLRNLLLRNGFNTDRGWFKRSHHVLTEGLTNLNRWRNSGTGKADGCRKMQPSALLFYIILWFIML